MSNVRPDRGAPADPAPLAVSVGDPAGVGPLVSLRAALDCISEGEGGIALFGDPDRLESMAVDGTGRGRERIRRVTVEELGSVRTGELALVPAARWDASVVSARAPTPEGGLAQLRALDAATKAVRAGRARALVTGPTSKEAIVRAGVAFTGQTEHLAARCGLERDAVTMMFLGPRLRVALVTTHLGIGQVPQAIRPVRVERAVVHLAEALLRLGGREGGAPSIAVTGLNPHAGEGGLFGDEEGQAIIPGIDRARSRPPLADGRVAVEGPIPAETAFRRAAAGDWDGVVAMMHDQATIASKLLDWETAVNVTWGLPFVRTSVDHGVAYDAAAAGTAHHGGMVAALRMAWRLTDDARGGSR